MRQYFVYILSNYNNTVLYTGVTNDLPRRIWQHRNNLGSKFTQKYKLYKLVYFEELGDPYEAIKREKYIKNLLRRKKEVLINHINPSWNDLSKSFT